MDEPRAGRPGCEARKIRRRNGLTRQDRTAPKFPDLVRRKFSAERPNALWVGDMTEIPTEHGKLYLATVIDLCSRKLAGWQVADHMRKLLMRDVWAAGRRVLVLCGALAVVTGFLAGVLGALVLR